MTIENYRLKGNIVSFQGKKAKIISAIWNNLIIVLQHDGKFSGEKIHTDRDHVTLLDQKKNPNNYVIPQKTQHKEIDYTPAVKTGSYTEKNYQDENIYIDSDTKQAFENAGGGDYITQQELAHLGQIFRSAEGCDIFKGLTNIHIGGKADMEAMFRQAANGKLPLSEILKNPFLEKYGKKKTMFGFD